MEKNEFFIEYDEEQKFIRVKNPLDDKGIEKLYKEDYYKKNKIQKKLKDEEWNKTMYLDKYSSFEEYLDVDKRSILDIGCGIGSFLEIGKQRGWSCAGVEPSIQAFQCAKELLNEKEKSFPMDMFLLMGDDYINNKPIGSQLHSKRVQFDMTLSKYNNKLKRKFY